MSGAESLNGGTHVPEEEFVARQRQAAAMARERGLDALLVWGDGSVDSFHEVYYFTNQVSAYPWVPPCPPLVTACEHSGALISADATTTLFASNYVRDVVHADVVRTNWDLRQEVLAAVEENGLAAGRVGLIGEDLPWTFVEALRRRFPGLRLEAAEDISAELRVRLSDVDAMMLRRSGEAGVRIMRAACQAAVPGATEGDFVGAGMSEAARIPGCLHWKFMAAAGPDASRFVYDAVPTWNPTYVYRQGDPAHTDLFGFVEGYPYDLARTFTVGEEPSKDQARVVDGARGLCWTLAETLRPGVTPGDLHRAGMAFLRENGVKPTMTFGLDHEPGPDEGPGFGHAIGCGFIPPYIVPHGPWADRPLGPPMGLAFETFVTDGRGHYGNYEDMFLWLESGVECVTPDI
jgi:Xaa-Pro aminopeptidase